MPKKELHPLVIIRDQSQKRPAPFRMPTFEEISTENFDFQSSKEQLERLKRFCDCRTSVGNEIKSNDFKTVCEVGAGNGGFVNKVIHTKSKVILARKIIRLEVREKERNRIVNELEVLHKCNSPYIIGFFGAFHDSCELSILMEYMDGGSLDQLLRKVNRVPENICSRINYCVLKGMNYLREKHRIIHRDVKPSNILVNCAGEIKLCDLGVSAVLYNSEAYSFIGSRCYMSPERLEGTHHRVQADIWSLGISLMELALGRYPIPELSVAQLKKKFSRDVFGRPLRTRGKYGHSESDKNNGRGTMVPSEGNESTLTYGQSIKLNKDGKKLKKINNEMENNNGESGSNEEDDDEDNDGDGDDDDDDSDLYFPSIFDQLQLIVRSPSPKLPNEFFSEEFVDFIEICLRKEPIQRSDLATLLNHPFAQRHADLIDRKQFRQQQQQQQKKEEENSKVEQKNMLGCYSSAEEDKMVSDWVKRALKNSLADIDNLDDDNDDKDDDDDDDDDDDEDDDDNNNDDDDNNNENNEEKSLEIKAKNGVIFLNSHENHSDNENFHNNHHTNNSSTTTLNNNNENTNIPFCSLTPSTPPPLNLENLKNRKSSSNSQTDPSSPITTTTSSSSASLMKFKNNSSIITTTTTTTSNTNEVVVDGAYFSADQSTPSSSPYSEASEDKFVYPPTKSTESVRSPKFIKHNSTFNRFIASSFGNRNGNSSQTKKRNSVSVSTFHDIRSTSKSKHSQMSKPRTQRNVSTSMCPDSSIKGKLSDSLKRKNLIINALNDSNGNTVNDRHNSTSRLWNKQFHRFKDILFK
ncbi:hypothetical protein SNEBB_004805 [Seison nebaliae]|nr:hypothetical protein SNEBB_004805 [Seison nebaliae]